MLLGIDRALEFGQVALWEIAQLCSQVMVGFCPVVSGYGL
jgi:hypothetical protein